MLWHLEAVLLCIVLTTDETEIESDICGRHPYKEVATEDMEAAKILLEVRNGKRDNIKKL